MKPDGVEAVGCGQHHTIVATQVTVTVIIIVIVVVPISLSLISVQSGALWAMGSNSDGQLGVGRNPEWTSVPIQIHGTPMIMTINVDDDYGPHTDTYFDYHDHGNHDDGDGPVSPWFFDYDHENDEDNDVVHTDTWNINNDSDSDNKH